MPLTETEELELLTLEEQEASVSQTNQPSLPTSTLTPPPILDRIFGLSPPRSGEEINPRESATAFGKGLINPFNINPSPIQGSVFEPNSTARKAGQLTGIGGLIGASTLTGGAAVGIGAEAAQLSPFAASILEATGTGMTFEGIKGAVTGRDPVETVNKAAENGLIFAGFGAVGGALGYMRRVFGEKTADFLANHFINTDRKIAEKLLEQGKPSLGRQFLETDLPGFKNRREVWDKTGEELTSVERRIRGRLDAETERLKTTNAPDVAPSGRVLEYKPGTIQEAPTPAHPSGGVIATPAVKMENIPEKTIPFAGDAETIEKDVFGVTVRQIENGSKTPGIFPQTKLGGFTKETPVGSLNPTTSPVQPNFRGNPKLGETPAPGVGMATARPGTIDLTQVVDSLAPLKKNLDIGTEERSMKVLDIMGRQILKRNGDHVGLETAMSLKRSMDNLVGDAYVKGYAAKIPVRVNAYENMANTLRALIYKVDPVMGRFAAQESLMIRLRVGLKPVTAESGGAISPFFWSNMANFIEGSPVSNVAAKVLKQTLGKPSTVFAPITKHGARVFVGSQENK